MCRLPGPHLRCTSWQFCCAGYLIFYTTDAQQEDRDWVVEGVVGGDKLSTVINKLTPDTTYYFKVQARNRKGYGPMSRVVKHRTLPGGSCCFCCPLLSGLSDVLANTGLHSNGSL